jgi:DeoR family transcriptional regulator, fructose operon transcriptional repressor
MKAIPLDGKKEETLDTGAQRRISENVRVRSVDVLRTGGALPAKRHCDLLHLIRRRGQMTVRELSACLHVSGDTVRRDLESLARHGFLTRTYGGAVANEIATPPHATLAPRTDLWHPAEKTIAQAASRLIADSETLLLNGGSATMVFAAELGSQNITVVTNNLGVPGVVPAHCEVYVLGGRYRRDSQETLGPLFLAGVSIAVDTAIIGVGGITVEQGLTTALLEEALTAAAMIEAADRTIVLVEASKFGQRCLARIAPVAGIDILVTDREPPRDLAQALAEAQVQVIIAGKEQGPAPG